MSAFGDALLLRYLTAANVDTLLVPAADANKQRVRNLLATVYEPRLLNVESVDSITVTRTDFEVPVIEPMAVRGTLDRVTPSSEQTLATFQLPAIAETNWVDMILETTVSVRVSSTAALLDAIGSEDVSNLTQQAFIAKFQFLDLPELMAAAGVATYQQLQADFPRLYHLHYADPPKYDPEDPAAERTYRLRIAVLFFPTLDLQGAMRNLVQSRRALDALHPRPEGYEGGDLLASSAWIGVFPTGAFQNVAFSESDVTDLLAADRFVAAFETV